MLVAAGLASVQVPIGGMIAASDRMWTGFVLNLGWSVALVGATYLLVERGSFGLACAQALAYGVQAAGAFAFARGALRGAVREV